MKTKNMYLNRLLKLAEFLLILDKNNPDKKYKAEENGISIEHFHWALNLVSGQWQDKGLDNSSIRNLRQYETLYKAAGFFSLTADQVFHLFVPGYQDECYGGKMLTSKTTPTQLSNHILEFVKIKNSELEEEAYNWKPSKREKQCKIITLKPNYHEERKYANHLS